MSLPPGYAPSPGHPYPVPLHGHIFPPHVPPPYHPHIIPQTLRPETDIKGQDPQMLDMSNTKASELFRAWLPSHYTSVYPLLGSSEELRCCTPHRQ